MLWIPPASGGQRDPGVPTPSWGERALARILHQPLCCGPESLAVRSLAARGSTHEEPAVPGGGASTSATEIGAVAVVPQAINVCHPANLVVGAIPCVAGSAINPHVGISSLPGRSTIDARCKPGHLVVLVVVGQGGQPYGVPVTTATWVDVGVEAVSLANDVVPGTCRADVLRIRSLGLAAVRSVHSHDPGAEE